jgi:hypothetical protein
LGGFLNTFTIFISVLGADFNKLIEANLIRTSVKTTRPHSKDQLVMLFREIIAVSLRIIRPTSVYTHTQTALIQ